MNDSEKQIIQKNFSSLIKKLNSNELLNSISINKFFDENFILEIKNLSTNEKRNTYILIKLCNENKFSINQLLNLFEESKQEFAVNLIKEKFSLKLVNLHLDRCLTSNNNLETLINKFKPIGAKVKTNEKFSFNSDNGNTSNGINVYKMTANPRGYCLIVNNVNFDSETYDRRDASDKDAELLTQIFEELFFIVIRKNDLSTISMFDFFKDFSRKTELNQHDCLAVIILSHGTSDSIVGADGTMLPIEMIKTTFNNVNCPALIGKPKMFFLQACRGGQFDTGVNHVVTDSKKIVTGIKRKLPSLTDMIISYSTIHGHVSFRDPALGSWYARALSNVLSEFACKLELLEILKLVSEEIMKHTTFDDQSISYKQAASFDNIAFNKNLYFYPGHYRISNNNLSKSDEADIDEANMKK